MAGDMNPYACWLAGIEGVGNKTIRALLTRTNGAEEIFGMPEEEIAEILGSEMKKRQAAEKTAAKIAAAQKRDPAECAARIAEKGISFTSMEDEKYPERLRDIPDPPYALYYYGDLPAEGAPSVAIIGSRNCSSYGREQARIFAEKIAASGISVVSGMARGIDGIAGRAAINAGGRSYAVLGCGVDVIYPRENEQLYYMLKEKGGIISENPPGTEPRSVLFPMRNRLISGLSDAALIVESRRKSGTVITVDSALEQGRDIFAIPGRVCDSLSDGCNYLISQGAGIACSPDTILEHFWGVSDTGTDMTQTQRKLRMRRREELDGMDAVFFDVLGVGEVMETEFLISRAEGIINRRIGADEFVSCMVRLQLLGLAREIGMGHYMGI